MYKECVVCGKRFQGRGKTCSESCSLEFKKQQSKRYREEHKAERAEYFRKRNQEHYGKAKIVPKSKGKDPDWIQKYTKADRLTQISMLAIALTDCGIALMTYGKLSMLWGTEQYERYEQYVFKAKRKEYESINTSKKNSIKSKNRPKDI